MYYFTNAIVVTTWMRTKRYIIARCSGQASLLLWIGRSCHFAFIYGEGIRIFYFQTVRLDIFTHIAMTEFGIPKAQCALDHYPTASSVIIAKLIQPGQRDERLLIIMKGGLGKWILSSWSADSDNRLLKCIVQFHCQLCHRCITTTESHNSAAVNMWHDRFRMLWFFLRHTHRCQWFDGLVMCVCVCVCVCEHLCCAKKMWFILWISLRWPQAGVLASHITNESAACSTVCPGCH